MKFVHGWGGGEKRWQLDSPLTTRDHWLLTANLLACLIALNHLGLLT